MNSSDPDEEKELFYHEFEKKFDDLLRTKGFIKVDQFREKILAVKRKFHAENEACEKEFQGFHSGFGLNDKFKDMNNNWVDLIPEERHPTDELLRKFTADTTQIEFAMDRELAKDCAASDKVEKQEEELERPAEDQEEAVKPKPN